MSSYDSFMFPEFLPIGLVGRPYGGVKTEPPDVKAEEDLPRRFMFGCLQKGSFRKTESSWWASYQHPTREIRAEVAYDGILEVNFSWQGEKWMAVSPGQTFTDIHLCIYPKSLDAAMKERLEQRYNLAYSIPDEKVGRDCCFPDGPPRCMVCPIRVSNLGTARKALQAMEKDEAIVAPLFACAVMGSRPLSTTISDWHLLICSIRSFQPFGCCLPRNCRLLGRQKGINRRMALSSFAYPGGNISLPSRLSSVIWSG